MDVQNLNQIGTLNDGSPRVMELIDPCRAATVRRYAAELADHNGNSHCHRRFDIEAL